jgi:DNA-binding transcriptional LysR family regulator
VIEQLEEVEGMPSPLADVLARNFPLVIKPHPLPLPEFDIALYWHDRYHRDPANKWFREFVATQLHSNAW